MAKGLVIASDVSEEPVAETHLAKAVMENSMDTTLTKFLALIKEKNIRLCRFIKSHALGHEWEPDKWDPIDGDKVRELSEESGNEVLIDDLRECLKLQRRALDWLFEENQDTSRTWHQAKEVFRSAMRAYNKIPKEFLEGG